MESDCQTRWSATVIDCRSILADQRFIFHRMDVALPGAEASRHLGWSFRQEV